MKKIAIFGAGGCGREIRWLIDDINSVKPTWDFIGFFDDDFSHVTKVDEKYFLGGIDALNNYPDELFLVIGIGSAIVKRKIVQKISNISIRYPVLIHPSVIVGTTNITIGEGTVVCAGSIITMDIEIGKHNLFNICCTVSHDSIIGDYGSFMSAVNISGEVTIGEAVYIGVGAKIINQLSIGDETIIGAGAVVTKSIPQKSTAVGVPAKVIK